MISSEVKLIKSEEGRMGKMLFNIRVKFRLLTFLQYHFVQFLKSIKKKHYIDYKISLSKACEKAKS